MWINETDSLDGEVSSRLRLAEGDSDHLSELLGEADYLTKHGSLRDTPVVGGALKRTFDIVFSIAAILASSVLMIAIALCLKSRVKGPVIFAHERVGAGGRRFRCLKFRTMVVDADEQLRRILDTDPDAAAEFAETQKLRNDPRIVPCVGKFLRRTSLDELPQFFNVLLGDMSVVGPRPVTEGEFCTHYGSGHDYINARPGITGLWQISGRNEIDYSERVMLDAAYVRNWNFGDDLSIILKTASVVCISQNGH